jgi:hypothetical protein
MPLMRKVAWAGVAVYHPLPDGTGTISRLPGCP